MDPPRTAKAIAGLVTRASKAGSADFRLAPGSPGKDDGKDGKDLGADVDLVGPGHACEKW